MLREVRTISIFIFNHNDDCLLTGIVMRSKNYRKFVCCLVVRFRSTVHIRSQTSAIEVPNVSVILRDPSPYLSKFQRKGRKIPKGKVDK